jgi:geranylgeranyl diphosphate synthase, type II
MPPVANKYQQFIEAEIARQKFGRNPPSLYEPIRYLMSLGGKRLRPMLTLLAYTLYKNDPRSIIRFAVAVEAFHNFTLMHDDIMDKAPLRRGKPSVHKKWNVNTAILSGDVMLVKVYESFCSLDAKQLQTVLESFNQCASEVCEGQQLDMEFETRKDVPEKEYIGMIRQKTAVLLGFSLELGAILAGAPEADRRALKQFGINIGIGFQLKDDLLDAYADPKKFGKQVGGDILSNKKTYLLINALEKAKGNTKRQLEAWLNLRRFNKKKKIAGIMAIYEKLQIARLAEKKVDFYFRKGFKNLDAVQAKGSKKQILRHFTEGLIGRQS